MFLCIASHRYSEVLFSHLKAAAVRVSACLYDRFYSKLSDLWPLEYHNHLNDGTFALLGRCEMVHKTNEKISPHMLAHQWGCIHCIFHDEKNIYSMVPVASHSHSNYGMAQKKKSRGFALFFSMAVFFFYFFFYTQCRRKSCSGSTCLRRWKFERWKVPSTSLGFIQSKSCRCSPVSSQLHGLFTRYVSFFYLIFAEVQRLNTNQHKHGGDSPNVQCSATTKQLFSCSGDPLFSKAAASLCSYS